ncbi:MAG: hypothetical protein CMB25_02045 [Euryarchaeota archaeon]|nr:hypothetical protein [Euryarchaeota archaeon]
MCDGNGVLTLGVLINDTTHEINSSRNQDCLTCDNSCQKSNDVDIVRVVKMKSKCCKRYERKKKSHCKGCPERNKGVA